MKNQKEEESKIIEKKVNYFFKKNSLVHVNLKNGIWKNGLVKEVSADFFILDELFDGEMVIFFLEVKDVSAYNSGGGR